MSSLHHTLLVVITLLSLLTHHVAALGALYGLPVLNGPIAPTPRFEGMKTRPGDFVHPGIWHTHDDLERIRNGVIEGQEPWKSAYANFSKDQYSLSNYAMQGPKDVLCRGQCSNYTSTFSKDVRAAYQNALMWYITRNDSHWTRTTTILDAWGSNLTSIIGVDTSLLVGLEGDMMVNAAEIIRWEGGITESGKTWSGAGAFANMVYWLLAKQSINIGQANYGMVSIKALMSFAVYLDDVAMYNYGLYSYMNDLCAGVYANFHPRTGQGAETGRDQGHAQGAIGWAAEAARTAQSQGFDAYSLGDNLILKAAEYTAKYNLGQNVSYDPDFYRCEGILVGGPWSVPSNVSRGVTVDKTPRIWDIVYYQYAVKRGLPAPWTTKMKEAIGAIGGEGAPAGNSQGDHPSWGDLIWSYPGKGAFLNDNSRTIWGGGNIGPNGVGFDSGK